MTRAAEISEYIKVAYPDGVPYGEGKRIAAKFDVSGATVDRAMRAIGWKTVPWQVCKNGHQRTEDNLTGHGECKTCVRDHAREYMRKRRARA